MSPNHSTTTPAGHNYISHNYVTSPSTSPNHFTTTPAGHNYISHNYVTSPSTSPNHFTTTPVRVQVHKRTCVRGLFGSCGCAWVARVRASVCASVGGLTVQGVGEGHEERVSCCCSDVEGQDFAGDPRLANVTERVRYENALPHVASQFDQRPL